MVLLKIDNALRAKLSPIQLLPNSSFEYHYKSGQCLTNYFQYMINQKTGIVSEKGKIVVPPIYNSVIFYNLFFIASNYDRKDNLYNTKGRKIYAEGINDYKHSLKNENIFLFTKKEKWGAINNSGKTVIPFEYKSIEIATGNPSVAVVEK